MFRDNCDHRGYRREVLDRNGNVVASRLVCRRCGAIDGHGSYAPAPIRMIDRMIAKDRARSAKARAKEAARANAKADKPKRNWWTGR